jgi:uncharacterized membrane protein YgcG
MESFFFFCSCFTFFTIARIAFNLPTLTHSTCCCCCCCCSYYYYFYSKNGFVFLREIPNYYVIDGRQYGCYLYIRYLPPPHRRPGYREWLLRRRREQRERSPFAFFWRWWDGDSDSNSDGNDSSSGSSSSSSSSSSGSSRSHGRSDDGGAAGGGRKSRI